MSPASSALPAPHDESIPLDAGGRLPVRVYGRRGPGVKPLAVHFHAGAFVAGGLDCGGRVAGLLAEAGAVVVSVDYPLAPARPFPDALEAGHAALAWAWRERARLAGASAALWVAGEEAGGNLAAALALMARDRRHPPLAGQILFSPMLDVCVATASLRAAQAGPVGCRWADGWHAYLAGPDDALHPYAAPGATRRLADLPPTLLLTAEDDPLHDEACAYAQRLREAGVPVDRLVLEGATGWPCSLMREDTERPDWADAVRDRLRQVLSTPSPARRRRRPA